METSTKMNLYQRHYVYAHIDPRANDQIVYIGMGKNPELTKQIIQLRIDGYTYQGISKILKLSPMTCWRYAQYGK